MLNKILLSILIFLVVIVAGTTVAIKLKRNALVSAVATNSNKVTLQREYDEYSLGQLRAVTKADSNEKKSSVIITPYLYYKLGDKEFKEELSKKSLALKEVFMTYFSSYTSEELQRKGENKIKMELFGLVNKKLSLGEVKEILFYEYIYFD